MCNIKSKLDKFNKKYENRRDKKELERLVQKLAHMAVDYRFSAMPDAPGKLETCRNLITLANFKIKLLDVEYELMK